MGDGADSVVGERPSRYGRRQQRIVPRKPSRRETMAKIDRELFDRLRQAGLRKRVAKTLSQIGGGANKKARQTARSAANELRSLADEIERRLPDDATSARQTPQTTSPRGAPARRRAPKSSDATTADAPSVAATAKRAPRTAPAKPTARRTTTTSRRAAPQPARTSQEPANAPAADEATPKPQDDATPPSE
jgi:hypothetical protein